MIKIKHTPLIIFSGLIWLAAGLSLFNLGLKLLTKEPSATTFFSLFGGKEEGATLLIATALFIGILKGKYVLKKSATQMLTRIYSLPNPLPITQAYSRKYFILLAGMMSLGMCIKYLGIPNDIRGFIDVAIGSALIQGSTHYFRALLTEKRV